MFTGLVEDLGTVTSVDATTDGVRIAINSPLARELKEGDSVAVNGVCLTATGLCGGELFGADVMNETLRRSSLSELGAGLAGEPRAAGQARLAPGRPHRPGARRRRRRDRGRRGRGFARRVTIEADPDCCATWSRRARSPSTASRSP